MKYVLGLCLAILVSASGVLWAGDKPVTPVKGSEAIPMSPGSVKLVDTPTVKEFPAVKAAVAFVKSADYAPAEGYTHDEAGIGQAYASMMKDGFDKLMKWAHATGTWPAGPAFAVYFEDPAVTDPMKLTCKICFPIAGEAKPAEGVTIEEFPAMKAVMLQYQGPYEESNNAWTTIKVWMEKNGYVSTGAPVEVYLKGPMDVKDAKDYLTEIRMPAKKGGVIMPKGTSTPK